MRSIGVALVLLFTWQLFADTPPQTNSEKYTKLIIDNELKQRFTDGQNQKLARYFKTSSHFAMAKEAMHKIYGGPTTRATIKIDDTHEVQWLDRGLGRPAEVNIVDPSGTNNTAHLYSNNMQTVEIIFEVTGSPNNKYVVIVLARYGSIDQKEAMIFNTQTFAEVARLQLFESNYAWVSPTHIMYSRMDDEGNESTSDFDVLTGTETNVEANILGQSGSLTLLSKTVDDKTEYTLVEKNSGQRATLTIPDEAEISGNDSTHVYFKAQKDNESRVLIADWTSLKNGSTSPLSASVLISESSMYIERVVAVENSVFTLERMGTKRRIRGYWSATGRVNAEIEIPGCCSPSNVTWLDEGKTVNVSFSSPVLARATFTYDLETGKWNKNPISMLTLDGVTYKSEFFDSISADGTTIPANIIYRSDITPNGNRPVLMKSYGGFDSPGYLDPRFDRGVLEFLKRGGIFVGPALRGGNEGGPAWHKAAVKENKIKTYQDLDAVARQLVTNGWTHSKKIAIQGTSNGGLTTAATALLYPSDFGLAIPIAGVDDLLGKDTLDSIYEGWSYEYGSSEKDADYLTKISPLENARNQGQVKFLIIDGAQDTRVNPAHSIKLAKALLDQGGNPTNTFLYTIVNGGHWAESVTLNGNIGLNVAIAIWTMIYDMAEF